MKKLLLILLCLPLIGFGQSLYNPQQLYDAPGGFFDEDSLRSIHLDFYNPNYHAYLVNSWYYNPDERIPAKLTLNGTVYDSVGVRYKGNSTFCLPNDNLNPKVPYNIDFNYFIDSQKVLGYKKMKLANAWMDPTFVKQIVSSNIYRNYLPSGESNLIKLYVQGNYLGLYINDESINKQFFKKHFDEKSGPLFKCDNIDRFCDTANAPSAYPPSLIYLGEDSSLYYNSYDMKSDNGWGDLVEFITTLNNNFSQIDSVLNVDRTLWAFAVNQVLLNLDCYNTYYIHNYYLYQTKDGLFQMIPWDLDNTFSGAIMGFDYFNQSNIYEYDPYHYGSPGERPLAEKLLNDPLYRKQYTAHIRTIMNESLDTAVIRNQINQLQSLAHTAADNDQWKGFSMSQYYSNVESALWTSWGFGGIMSTIDARKQYLLSHPDISEVPPLISNVSVNNNLVEANIFNSSSVDLMITSSQYNSKFQPFAMNDDGINGDLTPNDGIYSIQLPFVGNTNVKFYIRAENNDAMILSPERAEYEFYEYSTISGLSDSQISNKRTLLKVCDVLGRESRMIYNQPLFFLYSDGTVEKKIIFE
ncbi:MAG: CotH kinase family protein [Flavobacteriales bacterium]|nr:CotH kinase family protein [Flavobacteriales bacterium]